jgi:hypothetical protein
MTTMPEWRKSTRSTQGESDCVEVAVWRKSIRSAQGESNCVQVAVWRKSTRSAQGSLSVSRSQSGLVSY